jgi:hypothetical protein
MGKELSDNVDDLDERFYDEEKDLFYFVDKEGNRNYGVTLEIPGFDRVPVGCQAVINEKGEVYDWGKGDKLIEVVNNFRREYPNQVPTIIPKLDPNVNYIFNSRAA